MKADFRSADRIVFHTHRFPVAVCILSSAFTLEPMCRFWIRFTGAGTGSMHWIALDEQRVTDSE